jgi:hypothetical protein
MKRWRSEPVCRWAFSDAELAEVAAEVERADRQELIRRPGTGLMPAADQDPEEKPKHGQDQG